MYLTGRLGCADFCADGGGLTPAVRCDWLDLTGEDDGRDQDGVESHDRDLVEGDGGVEEEDDDHERKLQPEQRRLHWD